MVEGRRSALRRLGGRLPSDDGQGASELDDWLGEPNLDWAGDPEATHETAAPPQRARAADRADTGVDDDDLAPEWPARPVVERAELIRRRRTIALAAIFVLILAVVIPVTVLGGGSEPATTEPTIPTPVTGTGTTPDKTADEPATTTAPEPETPTASALAIDLPEGGTLRRGDRGTEVEKLQKALTALGHDAGEADGIFGQQTSAAVVAFQQANSLSTDGIVGAKTAAALNAALTERGITE